MQPMEKKSLHDLITEAHEVGLEGLDFLGKFGFAEIERGYNGIGPEFLPATVREKITEHLATFEAAAVIHDMRNDVSDGTRRGFYHANDEFWRNCVRLADHAYPWWSLRRYRARAVAKVLYRFVNAEHFGWKAWIDAHERYISRRASGTSPHAAQRGVKPNGDIRRDESGGKPFAKAR